MVIDACVLVSLLNSSDKFHNVVKMWLQKTESSFHAPTICIAEVSGALSRRNRDIDLIGSIIPFFDEGLVTFHDVDRFLAESAAKCASEMRLRGYDSVYVALAKKLKSPLVTLDYEVISKAKGIETINPENI